MPEGPEVRRTTDALQSTLQGEDLVGLSFLSGRYTKKDPAGLSAFQERGCRRIKEVSCKGKFIYFLLEDGSSIWNTLGMTGYWSHKPGKHVRAVVHSKGEMYYNDMRNFGTFKFSLSQDDLDKKLASIGPDLLSEDVSLKTFKDVLTRGARLNKTIAENIMNQSIVSGVGNYLKAEILYDAQISPHRVCSTLTTSDYRALLDSSKRIIRLSYSLGGATIKDYRSADGKNGVYTRRFAVYNQKYDPLGNQVVRESTADKRTTHWVPSLQK